MRQQANITGSTMSDMTGRLRSASETAKDAASKASETTRSGVTNAMDQANEAARSAAASGAEALETGRRAAERARASTAETAASLSEAFGAAIERQPFTAVMVAAAAGFLAGMILRRS